MKLSHEIRMVMYARKVPMQPELIRFKVFASRLDPSLYKQSLKRFTNVMYEMDDVEKENKIINGEEVVFWQFKRTGFKAGMYKFKTRVIKWTQYLASQCRRLTIISKTLIRRAELKRLKSMLKKLTGE